MELLKKWAGQNCGQVGSRADITRVMRAKRGEKEEVKFSEEVLREEEEKEGEVWEGGELRGEEKWGEEIIEEGWQEKEKGWEEKACGERRGGGEERSEDEAE